MEPAGTLGYMAPEFFYGPNITYKCDVFSFGVVLLELICRKAFFQIKQLLEENSLPNLAGTEDGEEINDPSSAETAHTLIVNVLKGVLNLAETRDAEGIIDQSLVGEIARDRWELYMDITGSCLSVDPNKRPDMGDVEVQLEQHWSFKRKQIPTALLMLSSFDFSSLLNLPCLLYH